MAILLVGVAYINGLIDAFFITYRHRVYQHIITEDLAEQD